MPEALYKPHGMSHFRRISLKEAQALEAAGKAYRPSAHQPGIYYGTAMIPDAVVEEEPPSAEEQPVKEQVYETRAMEAKPRTSRRRTLKSR
jgi:hypothetical protein